MAQLGRDELQCYRARVLGFGVVVALVVSLFGWQAGGGVDGPCQQRIPAVEGKVVVQVGEVVGFDG